MTLQITGVALLAEGIDVAYVRLDKDVRENGLLWRHSVLVPRDSDYDDEIEAVEEALLALLTDALDDEDRVPPLDVEESDEEESA